MSEHMQETFDAMVWHLRRQGRKAGGIDDYDKKFRCRYRAPDGAMCAIGYLIPDKDYRSEFEGTPAVGDEVSLVLEKYGHDVNLCGQMQVVHDNYEPHQWEGEFARVAKEFGLTYTPPEAA